MSKKELRETLNKDIKRFVETGGKITVYASRKRTYRSKETNKKEKIDINALPTTLKIRFGIM